MKKATSYLTTTDVDEIEDVLQQFPSGLPSDHIEKNRTILTKNFSHDVILRKTRLMIHAARNVTNKNI